MYRICSSLLALGFFLSVAWTPGVSAQTLDDVLRYSERSPATGAHDLGWVGANATAGTATYTALSSNPAGLGWATTSSVAGGLAADFTTNEGDFLSPDGTFSGPFERTQTEYRIGNVAFTYRVPTDQGSLTVGGAINRTRSFDRTLVASGLNAQSSITDTFLPPANAADLTRIEQLAFDAGAIELIDGEYIQAVAPGPIFDTNVEQREDLIETGGLYDASFGGAVEVAPNVMLGGSLIITFGSYTFDRIYEEVDVNNTHTNDLYDVLLDDGTLLQGFDALTFEQAIDADLAGVGGRFGASVAPASNLKLGVSFATPVYYTITETFGTRIETFFNEGSPLSAGGLDDFEFEYEVRTPWRVSLGGELSTGPLTLAGDLEVVDWSTLDIRASGERFTTLNRAIRDLDVTVNSRFGAAFDLNDLTLRAGLAYQPEPDPNGTRGDRTFLSGGLSYQFGPQLTLDFGWMQERFNDAFRPYGDVEVPDERTIAQAPQISEDVMRNVFKLGMRYQF